MKKVELLSPAGDMECLKAAVSNGADAVYFGGSNFGARAYAKNFDRDEIIEAVKYCHLYGVRVFVTVNTIMYENEIDSISEYVSFLHKVGVDALIVQDLGVMNLVRNKYPNMEIHASTQAHNYDEDSLRFMKKMGCKRAVLAREVSLDEIKKMNVDIEKEVFVHGALCLSYSGNCLFSALNNNRSGNRGKCAQSCRMKYKLIKDNKEVNTEGEYLLSTKSLYTLDHIGELIEAGIDSFKIEGRMKSKEYVGYVTRLYREKIDEYYEKYTVTITEEEINNLKVLYNRDFTNGYLFNKYNKDFMNIKSCNHIGVVIGDVLEIDKKYIKIKLRKDLNQEDGIRFDNDEGMIVNRLYNSKKLLVSSAKSGEIIYLDNKFDIKKCKIIRKTIDKKLNDMINSIPPRKVDIEISCNATLGKPLRLELKCGRDTITKEGCIIEEAKTSSITKERIEEQLLKLGNTPFKCSNININSSDNIFISIKELNELRRSLIDELISIRENRLPHDYKEQDYKIKKESNKVDTKINIFIKNEDQLEEVIKFNIDSIYTDNRNLYDKYKDKYDIYLKLERVDTIKESYSNERLLIENTSQINRFKDNNKLVTDTYLNIVNSYSIDYLNKNNIDRITLSYESDLDNIKEISNHISLDNVELIIYGRANLMIMKHDVIGYLTNNDYNYEYFLEGVNKERFKVTRESNITTIYHKDITDRINELEDLKELGIGYVRVEFLDDKPSDIKRVLNEVFYG